MRGVGRGKQETLPCFWPQPRNIQPQKGDREIRIFKQNNKPIWSRYFRHYYADAKAGSLKMFNYFS